MERACSSVPRKAPTLPISGFGAPGRIARPTVERAMSAALPGAIVPCSIKSLRSGRGRTAISKVAPAAIACFNAEVSRNSMSIVMPCACSKRGTSSAISGRMAPPLRILIFIDIGEFYSGLREAKVGIDPVARFVSACQRCRFPADELPIASGFGDVAAKAKGHAGSRTAARRKRASSPSDSSWSGG